MNPKILVTICISILLALTASPQTPYVPDSDQLQDVQEAAFRYFFVHELAGSKAQAFCISSVKPFLPGFIQRFANNDPPVVALSKCPFVPGKSTPLLKTREHAERVGLMSFHWVSSAEVEVRGHCRDGELGFSQLLLRLVKKGGHWSVVSVEAEVYS